MDDSRRQADRELQRILALLQGAVRLSTGSQSEVDLAIQRRRGYLSHVFHGVVDLKVKDLLRVLSALDLEADRFLNLALDPEAAPEAHPAEILRLMAGAWTAVDPSPNPLRGTDDEAVRARVSALAQQVVAGWRAAGGPTER